jgi:hypothetical protein
VMLAFCEDGKGERGVEGVPCAMSIVVMMLGCGRRADVGLGLDGRW